MRLLDRLGSAPRPVVGATFTAFSIQLTLAVSGVLAARILGVEDRGHLALFMLLPIIAAQLGVAPTVAATYYIARDPGNARAVVRTLTLPALVQVVVLTALQVAALLVVLASSSAAVRTAGLLTLPAVPAILAQQYGLAVLQGERRFRALNAMRLLPAVLYAGAVVVLFVTGVDDLVDFTAAWITATILTGAVTLSVALSRLPVSQESPASLPPRIEMLRFGARAWMGTTSPSEYFQLDSAIAGLFLSPAALGLYVAGVAFTNLPRFVAVSIGMVAYPSVAASPAPERRSAMWRFFFIALALSALIVLALELSIGWLLPLLFGDEFADAVTLTRILLVGALLYSARRVLIEGARGAGRPGLGSAVELVSFATLLVGIAVLAPTFGVKGIAAAVSVAAGISLAVLCGALLLEGADRTARIRRGPRRASAPPR